MLLTTLLSSASSLAVPSAAQKHFPTGSDQHGGTLPVTRPPPQQPAAVDAPALLLPPHPQHPERRQHGHRRPADSGALGARSSEESADGEPVADLYNLTLTAMRQYLRNHLNASRLGKAPRKRSHVQVDDVDLEFYRRFKEFNSSQVALDGTMHQLLVGGGLNSSQQEPAGAPKRNDDPDRPSAADVTPEPAVTTSASSASSSSSAGTAASAGSQRDYSVLMDDPRGYITASSSFPLRPGKTSTTWNTTFAQHRGYVYGLVSFSVICALVLGLFGVFRCLRATTTSATRATAEALTLPIQFLTDDLAPLNADLNHLPVPMLSVQSPGCAGMERLGVPARGSIGSPPLRNERAGFHHQQQQQQTQQQQQQSQHQQQQQQQQQHPQQHSQQQQLQQQQQQSHHHHHHHHHRHQHHHQYHQQPSPASQHLRLSSDLILSSSTSSNFRSSSTNHHNQSYLFIPHQANALGGVGGGSSGSSSINYKTHYSNSSYGSSSIGSAGSANLVTTNFPHCTYHVPLPDGEYGPDRDLQIRTPSQQSEIPRTYVKAPPNKTVRDVPVQYQSTSAITATHGGTTTPTPTGTGSCTITNAALVDGQQQQQLSYYSGARTIGRPVDGGRLAAAAPGPSLGGTTTAAATAAATAAGGQQKSSDKLQKILRLFPGKTSKSSSTSSTSSTSSSASSSSSSSNSSNSSGINNANNNNNVSHHGGGVGGTLQLPHPGVLPGSHNSSTSSLNNNSSGGSSSSSISSTVGAGVGGIATGSVISSISGTYGPNSVSNGIGCSSNHVNNNRVGCGGGRVDGRGGLSLATGGGGAGIHNHNQHYRSPPAAAAAAVCALGLGSSPAASLSSPTASSTSSASSASSAGRQPGSEAIVSGSPSVVVPAVPGSASADGGHAPFTM